MLQNNWEILKFCREFTAKLDVIALAFFATIKCGLCLPTRVFSCPQNLILWVFRKNMYLTIGSLCLPVTCTTKTLSQEFEEYIRVNTLALPATFLNIYIIICIYTLYFMLHMCTLYNCMNVVLYEQMYSSVLYHPKTLYLSHMRALKSLYTKNRDT